MYVVVVVVFLHDATCLPVGNIHPPCLWLYLSGCGSSARYPSISYIKPRSPYSSSLLLLPYYVNDDANVNDDDDDDNVDLHRFYAYIKRDPSGATLPEPISQVRGCHYN